MNQIDSPTLTKKTGSKIEKSERQEERTVRFANTDDGKETKTIYTVLSLSQMSKEEINKSWYNEFEFKIMKLGMIQVLRKVIAGTYEYHISSIETEARGLENKTPEGSDERKKNRYAALFAVLDEQERHREHGQTPDPKHLAKLYRQSSANCQMKAIQIASSDARIVHGEQELTISESKMTKKLVPYPPSPATKRPSLACTFVSPHKVISQRHLMTAMS